MNKDEFIKKLLARHLENIDEKQIKYLQEDYNSTLEENTDFDELFQTYLEEYNFNTPPKPAWFKQRAKKKIVQSSTTVEIRDLLVVMPDGNQYQFAYEYPLETEQQAIAGIKYRLKDKKYKLYRIAKIDEGEDGIRREKQEIYI